MKQAGRGQAGFSLMEVFLAVSILGVGLAGVLKAYGTSITVLASCERYLDLVDVLKKRLQADELRFREERKVPEGGQAAEGSIAWRREVRPLSGDNLEGMFAVTLTVGGGREGPGIEVLTYYDEGRDGDEE